MEEPIEIRQGTVSDEPWILDLGEELFCDLGNYREILGHWLALPKTMPLVAFSGEAQLGFALVSPERSIGFLYRPWAELVGIGVCAGNRRQGTGSALLRETLQIAARWRAREVRLHTAVSNRTGQKFFESQGFDFDSREVVFYPSGEEAVKMVLPLAM